MTPIAIGLTAWSTGVVTVSAVAIIRATLRRAKWSRLTHAADADGTRAERVVVIRPCAGLEPHLRRCLESTASLRTRGPWRLVLTTSTDDDPARPLLEEVAEELRAAGGSVTVTTVVPRGANLKASQLAGVLDTADDDIALVVDSDVELDHIELDRLLRPLTDPASSVAAVWCPPVEREPSTVADQVSAAVLGGSLHAFALLGTLDSGGLCGKTFAVRLDALRAIGGLSSLCDRLGEDMELSRRLRARGHTVTMAPRPVASLASGRSGRAVFDRYVRWLMVIRAQRRALLLSYPLLLAATPGLVLCTGLALGLGLAGTDTDASRVLAVALTLVLVARLAVAAVARWTAGRPLRPAALLLDAVLADGLLLAAFVRVAFGPARVRWRQRSLRLGPRGALEGP